MGPFTPTNVPGRQETPPPPRKRGKPPLTVQAYVARAYAVLLGALYLYTVYLGHGYSEGSVPIYKLGILQHAAWMVYVFTAAATCLVSACAIVVMSLALLHKINERVNKW